MPRGSPDGRTTWASGKTIATTTVTGGAGPVQIPIDSASLQESTASHWSIVGGALQLDRDPGTLGTHYEIYVDAGVSAYQTGGSANVVDEALVMWVEHYDGAVWTAIQGSYRYVCFQVPGTATLPIIGSTPILGTIAVPNGSGHASVRQLMGPGDRLQIMCEAWKIPGHTPTGATSVWKVTPDFSSLFAREIGHAWLESSHDVSISGALTDNDLVSYEATGDRYEAKSVYAAGGVVDDRMEAAILYAAVMAATMNGLASSEPTPETFTRLSNDLATALADAGFPDVATHGSIPKAVINKLWSRWVEDLTNAVAKEGHDLLRAAKGDDLSAAPYGGTDIPAPP